MVDPSKPNPDDSDMSPPPLPPGFSEVSSLRLSDLDALLTDVPAPPGLFDSFEISMPQGLSPDRISPIYHQNPLAVGVHPLHTPLHAPFNAMGPPVAHVSMPAAHVAFSSPPREEREPNQANKDLMYVSFMSCMHGVHPCLCRNVASKPPPTLCSLGDSQGPLSRYGPKHGQG